MATVIEADEGDTVDVEEVGTTTTRTSLTEVVVAAARTTMDQEVTMAPAMVIAAGEEVLVDTPQATDHPRIMGDTEATAHPQGEAPGVIQHLQEAGVADAVAHTATALVISTVHLHPQPNLITPTTRAHPTVLLLQVRAAMEDMGDMVLVVEEDTAVMEPVGEVMAVTVLLPLQRHMGLLLRPRLLLGMAVTAPLQATAISKVTLLEVVHLTTARGDVVGAGRCSLKCSYTLCLLLSPSLYIIDSLIRFIHGCNENYREFIHTETCAGVSRIGMTTQ